VFGWQRKRVGVLAQSGAVTTSQSVASSHSGAVFVVRGDANGEGVLTQSMGVIVFEEAPMGVIVLSGWNRGRRRSPCAVRGSNLRGGGGEGRRRATW
jgi:hypothetical protein